MDQIRAILGWIKKNYFWVSCGVIVLVGFVVWWMVTGNLAHQTEQNRTAIEADYAQLETISRQQQHPNPIIEEQMLRLIANSKKSVNDGWKEQFEQQGKEIFVWPDFLPEQAIDSLSKMRPIEVSIKNFPMTPAEEKLIPSEYRYDYNQNIEDELEKLAEHIGAVWNPVRVSGGSEGGGGDFAFQPGDGSESSDGGFDSEGNPVSSVEPEYVVKWSTQNQGEIRAKFDWTERPERAPTTIEMLYAQEDLWVLKSLMEVVKDTNGEADAAYNAVIREVKDIKIGRDASSKAGSILRLAGPSSTEGGDDYGEDGFELDGGEGAGAPDAGGDADFSQEIGDIGPGGEDGFEDGSSAPRLVDPAQFRYVDKTFKPLSAETLRESANADPGGEASVDQAELAYLAVAKRMPVRMRVRIDQRKLGKFLTACGNAPLTIEVRQVRVFTRQEIPGAAGSTEGGGSFEGGGGGFGEAPGGGGSGSSAGAAAAASFAALFSGAGGGGGGSFGASEGFGEPSGGGNATNMPGALDPKFPFDVNVEIYGIVYIYNPVNEKWFAIPEDATEQEDTNEVTDPLAEPPLTGVGGGNTTG